MTHFLFILSFSLLLFYIDIAVKPTRHCWRRGSIMANFRTFLFVVWLYAVICPITQGEGDRIFKDGDAIIGALLYVHREATKYGCNKIFLPGVNRAEAALYAIEQINKDANILPNKQLGYDIRDYCVDREKAMEHTYDLAPTCICGKI